MALISLRRALGLGLSVALSGASIAHARQGQPHISVDVTVFHETTIRDAGGREERRLEPVRDTHPGDTLLYRIKCTNRGDAVAPTAQIVDPIPSGTRLVPASWSLPDAEFAVSVDGGKSFSAFPIRLPVRLASGEIIQKEVDHSAYTHVRWSATRPLPPGESREAAYKVVVR